LRLEDVKGHLITPGQFLESAERANLSTSIDLMAIRKAARRAHHIDAIEVSINLSSKTLLDQTLILKSPKFCRIPDLKHKLRFEIADVTALQNLALFAEVLRNQEVGLYANMFDDFGLGRYPC